MFFIVGLGLGAVSFPKVADLESIYCQLLYSRDRTFVPLVETNSDEFLCDYKTHCFALCHCCEYDACDCEMTCPDNCTCYHDNSWSKNIAECSGEISFRNYIVFSDLKCFELYKIICYGCLIKKKYSFEKVASSEFYTNISKKMSKDFTNF